MLELTTRQPSGLGWVEHVRNFGGVYTPPSPLDAQHRRFGRWVEHKTRFGPRELLAGRCEDLHSIHLPEVLGFPAVGRGSAGLNLLHTESSQ